MSSSVVLNIYYIGIIGIIVNFCYFYFIITRLYLQEKMNTITAQMLKDKLKNMQN